MPPLPPEAWFVKNIPVGKGSILPSKKINNLDKFQKKDFIYKNGIIHREILFTTIILSFNFYWNGGKMTSNFSDFRGQ